MTLRVMDLFSGIGGFSLGLKRAGGFRTVAYCEIDPYCQKVLQARMSDGSLDTAPICADVRRLDGEPWAGRVDVIAGGFPCQDISVAGHRVGIGGERSGLWSEISRLVRQIRPTYVIVENVSALLVRGMDRVLGDLAACGYDAEWDCIPACAVGAPHRRDRVWIVAYPSSGRGSSDEVRPRRDAAWRSGEVLADPECGGLQGGLLRCAKPPAIFAPAFGGKGGGDPLWRPWEPEPAVGRLAHGVPNLVDQLRALGNSIVPQIIEWIGRRILKAQI